MTRLAFYLYAGEHERFPEDFKLSSRTTNFRAADGRIVKAEIVKAEWFDGSRLRVEIEVPPEYLPSGTLDGFNLSASADPADDQPTEGENQ